MLRAARISVRKLKRQQLVIDLLKSNKVINQLKTIEMVSVMNYYSRISQLDILFIPLSHFRTHGDCQEFMVVAKEIWINWFVIRVCNPGYSKSENPGNLVFFQTWNLGFNGLTNPGLGFRFSFFMSNFPITCFDLWINYTIHENHANKT